MEGEKKNQSQVSELNGLRKLWETLVGIWYTRNGHHTAGPHPLLLQHQVRVTSYYFLDTLQGM